MVDESIRVVAKNLFQKAEDYKNSVEVIIKSYNEKLHETEGELNEILTQLDRQQKLNTEAVGIISNVSEEIKLLEKENCQLEETIGDLKIDLTITKEKIDDLESSRCDLEKQLEMERESNRVLEERFRLARQKMAEIEQLTSKIETLEKQNETCSKECDTYKGKVNEYEKEIYNLNMLNKSFSEQCERYENLFMKYKLLESRNAELERYEMDTVEEPPLAAFQQLKLDLDAINDCTASNYNDIINAQTQKIKDMIEMKEKNLDVIKRRLRTVSFYIQNSDDEDKENN